MALSDYLTGNEWDACFYASFNKSAFPDFGASMRHTISKFLEAGYKFPGLTEAGEKSVQVEDGVNAPKILIFLGNPAGVNVREITLNGREYVKEHCPELLGETDEEWTEMVKNADEELAQYEQEIEQAQKQLQNNDDDDDGA